mmetsp:Transcript_10430/g.14592  ORF Transcript_10430/g.14592 Transcript_10430/m.14592 type:complete len:335 (-) Transcript_10430:115-1119(-)|eukprot:CAMPEP_0185728726 /NCGR_PEP_ID=MMETSP1171-20130828/4087_1 /TAXON_ID=374046 /ORGANISM="Helicotheca tamensis, Strain CCMP826" /LENGTH=334 /DNA_ID=CAMNT_0028397465 /DNA_START=31 /DNA_END=1035 /DNA_ORIENTATION=-
MTQAALVVTDQIRVMRRQEDKVYSCKDYLQLYCSHGNPCSSTSKPKPVDMDCRSKICKWFYQLIAVFDLSRETVAVAMSLLDRFLSSSSCRSESSLHNRKEYQLAAITALYMAIKLYDKKLVHPEIISRMSHGVYSKKEIEKMEVDILFALDWHLNGPTMLDFVEHFLDLLPQCAVKEHTLLQARKLMEHCQLQSEYAAGDYFFATKQPSTVAIASIYNALDEVSSEHLSQFEKGVFLWYITDVSRINPLSNEIVKTKLHLKKILDKKSENKDNLHREDSPSICGCGLEQKSVEGSGNISPKCVSVSANCRRSQLQQHAPKQRLSLVSATQPMH